MERSRSSDWFDPPCPATLATDWSPIKSRSRKVNEIVIRPDLIIRTVNGDAMRMKFFFFFSCDEKGKRGEGGRGGYYFFGCENFLIIIDEKSRSSCFWDLINAEIWRKIRKKNFCNFIRVIYLFFFFFWKREMDR